MIDEMMDETKPQPLPLRVMAEAFLVLQQIVQEIHALDLLLEVCAPIDIQCKRHILVTKDFRE